MNIPKEGYPVPYHPTFQILDASKITSYMKCPRKFFYRYVLGLEVEEPNIDLIYGEAIHRALAFIYTNWKPNLKSTEREILIQMAMVEFDNYYYEYFSELEADDNKPKNSECAKISLNDYCLHYIDEEFELLGTEIGGSVYISQDPERLVFAKMDAPILNEKGYIIREHKTTTMNLGQIWQTQWDLAIQTRLYSYMFYSYLQANDKDLNKFWGLEVNAIRGRMLKGGFQSDFIRYPVRLDERDLDVFLVNINEWYSKIEQEYLKLHSCSPSDPTMNCFQTTGGTACTEYFRVCPYHTFCISWKNPLNKLSRGIPLGFKEEWWDPRNRDKKEGS